MVFWLSLKKVGKSPLGRRLSTSVLLMTSWDRLWQITFTAEETGVDDGDGCPPPPCGRPVEGSYSRRNTMNSSFSWKSCFQKSHVTNDFLTHTLIGFRKFQCFHLNKKAAIIGIYTNINARPPGKRFLSFTRSQEERPASERGQILGVVKIEDKRFLHFSTAVTEIWLCPAMWALFLLASECNSESIFNEKLLKWCLFRNS